MQILLVDDEPAILRSMSRLLARLGVGVVTATSRDEALECLDAASFDAIVCDCRMAGLGADAFLDRLADRHADHVGRVVFTSGDLDDDGTQRLLARTGRAGLAKPYDADALLRALAPHDAAAPLRA